MFFPYATLERLRAIGHDRRWLFCCSTLLAVLSFPLTCVAVESPLTLRQAQDAAVAHSRQIAAQDAAISASRDMAVAAAQLPDPVVKVGIDNLPANGAGRFSLTNDSMTMRRIGVMQEFTRSEKRELRAERFNLAAEKSEAEKTAAMASVERDTAQAWLDRYYAEKMAAVLSDESHVARQEIEAAKGAYRGGRASQADVFAAESSLAMIEDRQSELAQRIANARLQLSRWTGLDPETPLAGAPAIDAIQLDTDTLDAHFIHHPEIVALTKESEIARTEAKLAKADRKPDWSVEVAYSQRGPGYSNMVSIGVSTPFPWNRKNRQDREWAARQATVRQAEAERDEMLRTHVTQTRAMVNEWQSGRARLSRYRDTLIPLARQRAASSQAAYRGGKAALADVLAVQRAESEVQLQALQLEADTARIWAQLNFLFPNEVAGLHMTPAKDLP